MPSPIIMIIPEFEISDVVMDVDMLDVPIEVQMQDTLEVELDPFTIEVEVT